LWYASNCLSKREIEEFQGEEKETEEFNWLRNGKRETGRDAGDTGLVREKQEDRRYKRHSRARYQLPVC
jgi:hypothetical protein